MLVGGPDRPLTSRGATARYRGSQADALQWLPTLQVDGARLPTGASGLSLVWSGGTKPFVVSLETESGAVLGAIRVEGHLLHLPNFVMPAEPVEIVVSDEGGRPLTARLRPGSPASSNAPASASVALDGVVAAGPVDRLDALRRLARLAGTNAEAASALRSVQQTLDADP